MEEVDGKETDGRACTTMANRRGSGGVRASRMCAHTGAKVAIVEMPFSMVSGAQKGGFGGTCVIRGCVPKKLLVYASKFPTEFEDCRGFGWSVDKMPTLDWKTLIANKTKEVERLNGLYGRMLDNSGVNTFEGTGRLVDRNTVEVTQATGEKILLRTNNVLIATGSKAFKVPVPGHEHGITSDEALCLPDLPKKIVIVGGGYIAVEFACIYNGLGSEVHLVYRQGLPLRGFDEECRELVAENLSKRGITLHPKHNPKKITPSDGGGYSITIKDHQVEKDIQADVVMWATGRNPNSKGIGLEENGVVLGAKGEIKVDMYSRTNVQNIWAIGDVTDRMNLTPVAIMEGMALAKTMFGDAPTSPDHTNVPSAVFTQPPLASCGLTEVAATEELEGELDVYTAKFRPMRNTLSGRDETTFMKLIVHVPTGRVVGAHMVGEDSPEIMQAIGVAMKCSATKAQFDSCVGIHPTTAEEFVTMRTPTRRVSCHTRQA